MASADFNGVTITDVNTTINSRPVEYFVVDIDLNANGIGFKVTDSTSPGVNDTLSQTTAHFLTQEGGQVAINASFFTPATVVEGTHETIGGVASSGTGGVANVYSPYTAGSDNLSFNITQANQVTFMHSSADATNLYNAVVGTNNLVNSGTVATGLDNEALSSRTAFGKTAANHLLLVLVQGKVTAGGTTSTGVTLQELANLMGNTLNTQDAIATLGGSNSALAVNDGSVHYLNIPAASDGSQPFPGGRPVGSNLVVFARSVPEPGSFALMGLGGGALLMARVRRSARKSGTPTA